MKNSTTLLIVGAKGYVGSALYASANNTCSAIGTSSSGGSGNLTLRLDAPAEFDYGEICPSDAVLLTAAISAPDICAREHDRAWAVNVTGTSAFVSKVIERGGRVIFFSSDTVYGERNEPFDELAPCSPAGEYAEMKHEVEQRFAGNPGFKAIRLSYVFRAIVHLEMMLKGRCHWWRIGMRCQSRSSTSVARRYFPRPNAPNAFARLTSLPVL